MDNQILVVFNILRNYFNVKSWKRGNHYLFLRPIIIRAYG